MNARLPRLAAVALFLAVLVPLGVSAPSQAAAPHDPILGSGSSWAANAISQWVADVSRLNKWRVDFNAVGAARGRQEFAIPKTDFGVSDIGYQGVDPAGNPDTSNGREFAYLPIAAGGTALPYHVAIGDQRIENIRLSGETVAKIFTSQITNWNDPQITEDNNGKGLPSIPITPVVHSEGAGVTNQFTSYLADQYPSIWGPCNGGKAEATEYFPLNCGKDTGNMKAFNGSDGVMNFLAGDSANGAIGIEEYSYPLLRGYPSIKLLNKAGYFTLPTQYNVAVALTKAVINNDKNSPDYLTQKLDGVYVNPDKRTYPLSSYVYAIIPTASDDAYTKTTGARQTLADFMNFSICQGQAEIGPIGYSSLPINLVQGGFEQIAKIKVADPDVDLADTTITKCHNPTFIAGKPNVNHLAQIAPNPPACDKVGADPCAAGVGSYNGDNPTDEANNQPDDGTDNPTDPGTTDPGTTDPGTTGPGSTDPGTSNPDAPGGGAPTTAGVGSDLGLGGTSNVSSNQVGSISATTLEADDHAGPTSTLTVLVIALLVAALAAPVWVSRLAKRKV